MKKGSPGAIAYLQFLRLRHAANDTSGWTPLIAQFEYRLIDEGGGEHLLQLRDALVDTGDEHFLAVTVCSVEGVRIACATIERHSLSFNGRLAEIVLTHTTIDELPQRATDNELIALSIWSHRVPAILQMAGERESDPMIGR